MQTLSPSDDEIVRLVAQEEQRQRDCLQLMASENYVSRAVLAATGSVLTNKSSEGYPGKRYYEGQQFIDGIETLAIERAKSLFGCEHANVQPHSGSAANLAVYLAFLNPGDTVLGLSLRSGGHLTHGWSASITGKLFRAVQYEVQRNTGLVDMNEVRELARKEKPKLIWAGGTALPRAVDFSAFADVAKEVGAIFAADISHLAGLIAGGVHPSPVGLADVVSTTTHKTLRGPRGALLLCRESHKQAIDSAVFPGIQSGTHNHITVAKAVALKEANTPAFREYARHVVNNAQALARALLERGYVLVSGGTDTHLLLCDLSTTGVPGRVASSALNRAGIVVNSNSVPFDQRKPFDPSGIRLGTAAITTRGLTEHHMTLIAEWIDKVIRSPTNEALHLNIAKEVREFLAPFPVAF